MNLPLYKNAATELGEESHRGLWFERFFNQYSEDWRVLDEKRVNGEPTQGKAFWIKQITKSKCGNANALICNAVLLHSRLRNLKGEYFGFKTDWHFATGLGLPHPVENGFLWHPTLGVPYLPGSAVKGLLRAWVEHWDDSLDEPARKQRVARWFGVDAETAKKEGTDEHAGGLIFFDALPIKPVELALDVMTPHYGKWYEQGGEIKNPNQEPEKVPADWHDPIPVPFLVVKQADFLFAIAPRRTSDQAAAKSAMKVLAEALDWLGAGAKTAVGYGRMNHDEAILHQVQTWVQEDQKQREDKQRLQEKLNRKAKLSPLEQAMEDIIDQRQDKNLAPYIALIHAVDAGQWQGDDKRQVAAKIRELMQQNKGQWKEQSGKPNKDREYQRTMKVKGWLE